MRHQLLGTAAIVALSLSGSLAFTLYVAAEAPPGGPGSTAGADATDRPPYAVARQDSGSGEAPPDLARAVAAVERLDSLRAALARSFSAEGVPADRDAFRRVCAPVGREARRMAESNGWKVEQLATKYRSPAHEADPEARAVMELMEGRPGLQGLWVRSGSSAEEAVRYFRRIEVRPACLECHGAETARPDFVKEGYPNDRAYGFSVGDLRGVYSVALPARSAAGSHGAPEDRGPSRTAVEAPPAP